MHPSPHTTTAVVRAERIRAEERERCLAILREYAAECSDSPVITAALRILHRRLHPFAASPEDVDPTFRPEPGTRSLLARR